MHIARNESTRIMHALLRDGFARRCLAAGLRNYDLARAARCFWFPEGFREGNKVGFPDLLKKKTYRRMVGKADVEVLR